jgi:hypothetical protein
MCDHDSYAATASEVLLVLLLAKRGNIRIRSERRNSWNLGWDQRVTASKSSCLK